MPKKVTCTLILAILFGCGKHSNENQNINLVQTQASIETLKMIAVEVDPNKHEQLLLNSTTTRLSPESADDILNYHSAKKINDVDFRTLFWNSSISRELLFSLDREIGNDRSLSLLDIELMNSIKYSRTNLKKLIDLIKDDSISSIPNPMKNALMDEALRIQEASNFKDNGAIKDLSQELKESKSANFNFLKQLVSILELSFYKNLLKNNKIVDKPNNSPVRSQEMITKFNINYNFFIGRCGSTQNSLQFSEIGTGFGKQCNTQTPSSVNLDVYNTLNQTQDGFRVDLLVNSFVRGGYDQNHKENATSNLNYELNGTIIIPRCENPSYCSQIINIMVSDFNRSFNNSNQTNDGVGIKVNGQYLENKLGNSLNVDISKTEAKIEITLTRSKKHVGTCCFNSADYQKVNLYIQKNQIPNSFINLTDVEMDKISPFHQIFDLPLFLNTGVMGADDFPSQTLYLLDKKLSNLLSSRELFDDYRFYFYSSLDFLNKSLEKYLKTGTTDPLVITNIKQLITSISDRIGRKSIYPLVISKQVSFSQAGFNQQSKLNSIIVDILNSVMSLNSLNDKISSIMSDKKNSLDNNAIGKLSSFQNSLKDTASSTEEVLKKITELQSEFNYINKRNSLEVELLNYERAQFE